MNFSLQFVFLAMSFISLFMLLLEARDFDFDGLDDSVDPDDDNDGILDIHHPDDDNDGILDIGN